MTQTADVEMYWWAATPFNSQSGRLELVGELIRRCRFARIVETGTYFGTTTAFLAQSGVPVTTVEIDAKIAAQAERRLARYSNVDLRVDGSVRVLRELAEARIDRQQPTLFYLDAHWEQSLPLWDEVAIALTHFARAVLVIDDFAVPDDPGYSFDDYGPGQRLTLDCLLAGELPPLSVYFPALPSEQENGARRGCVVATASAEMAGILDGIPLLRRWTA